MLLFWCASKTVQVKRKPIEYLAVYLWHTPSLSQLSPPLSPETKATRTRISHADKRYIQIFQQQHSIECCIVRNKSRRRVRSCWDVGRETGE
jgi:hypothetical protein